MSKKSLHIKASKGFEQEFALLGLQTPFKIKGNFLCSILNKLQYIGPGKSPKSS